MSWLESASLVALLLGFVFHRQLIRAVRFNNYTRGRKLKKASSAGKRTDYPEGYLAWGNGYLPESAATQHFLASGTTGSGKSLVQRRLMREPLLRLRYGSDSRVLIYDAKGDTAAYLNQIGVTVPVYSLNPFESRTSRPKAVAWDIARDITSPTDALNLACSLIKAEEGSNRYFADAARLVMRAVVLSLMKHAGKDWTFSDLVYGTTNRERLEEILSRDAAGQDTLAGFLPENNTGYCVASTIYSNMVFYEAVAAQWQRVEAKLSLKDWLTDSSVLILGDNEAASASLEVINRLMFRFLADQIDTQTNSSVRRTWVWVDEARLATCILKSDKLHKLAVKGRSRGVCLVLAFQDIDGFRQAIGKELANEVIAQCSNKALLRAESKESAEWASGLLGQYECLEVRYSDDSKLASAEGRSEQRIIKDAVMASELYEIPVTSRSNGLTGFFVTATWGAHRTTVKASELNGIVVGEKGERDEAVRLRPEADQWLRAWTPSDRVRLRVVGHEAMPTLKKKQLKLSRGGALQEVRLPKAVA